MSYTPSERLKGENEGELNLNLNPMMDMFAVLIPALLMMSVVVEVTIVEAMAPGHDDRGAPPPSVGTAVPLSLKLVILDDGYQLLTSQGLVPDEYGQADPKRPTIPLVEQSVLCSRYRGTWPPPRQANRERPKCPENAPLEHRSYRVYDTRRLTEVVSAIKSKHASERRIIIAGGDTVEFEAIVEAMDATRDTRTDDGTILPLFDEVIFSPGAY